MVDEKRNSGIDVIGSVPWGTHFCQFYKTKQDLIDILVPYFKAGLENNEFCMWVTSKPLVVAEAQEAMRGTVEYFDKYLRQGQIEIIPYSDWYMLGGTFDDDRVLKGWVSKLEQALVKGYAGLRLTGNTFWLERNHWQAFTEYEAKVNNVIGQYRMIAACTYNLDKCDGTAVIDVVKNHQFALINQEGKWDIIESAIYKQAKDALHLSEERFRAIYEESPIGIELYDADGKLVMANQACLDIFGASEANVKGFQLFEDPNLSDEAKNRLRRGETVRYEFPFDFGKVKQHKLYETSKSNVIYVDVIIVPVGLREGISGGYLVQVQDITKRKKSEAQIEALSRFPRENPNPVLRINKDGTIIYSNTSSQPLLECWHCQEGTKLPQLYCRLVTKALRSGLQQDCEVDCAGRIFSAIFVPVVDMEYVNIYGIDITDRKHAEEALRQSERDLNRAQAVAQIGSWRLDVRRNRLSWSDETHRIFGIPMETPMTYETFLSSVHPEEREYIDRKWQAALRGEPYDDVEHRIIVGDKVKWVRERAELELDEDGELKGGFGTVQDITERKRAEVALKESEEKFRIVSEFTYDWEYWRGPDTRFIYMSPSCLRFTGYTSAEFIEDPGLYLRIIHPDDRDSVEAHMREDMHHRERVEFEFRIIRRDGQERWISHACQPVLDEDGNFLGRRTSNRDITERKRMEDELRVKDFAVDSAASGIAIADLNGCVTYLNLACLSMWNYDEEEVLGKHVTFFFTDKNEAGAGLKAVLDEGAWQGELKAGRGDGSTFDVYVLANLVTDADGEPLCSMASFVDITEMKQMQEALRQSEESYRTLVEAAPDGVVSLDAEGRITASNEAFSNLLGYTKEDICGRHISEFATSPTQNRADDYHGQLNKKGRVEDEFEARGQQGQTIPLWIKAVALLDREGKLAQTIIYARDITERKKLDQLKDEFIGLVSHELRTPLTIISGCLSTVLTEWERLPSGEAQQLLRDAVMESESLSHLIENLLELSRAQAQQLSLYAELTDIKALVKETLTKVKRQASSHQFVSYLPDELQLINADPLRIERILYNLLDNAAKYSPPGTQIKVSARVEPERLVIGVYDRGRGLTPSEQARLFSPFQRLENSRPDRARGAGLGLIVCQRLVEAHGGEIWVESKKGSGSTFFFSLPYRKD
jgi:PAS domain S-box-containing protein